MNKPTLQDIRKNSKARFKVIDNTTKRALSRSKSLENELYKTVLKRVLNKLRIDTDGIVLNTPENRKIIANTGFIAKFLQGTTAKEIIKILNKGFGKLDNLAYNKYLQFGNIRNIKARLQKTTRSFLGFKARGSQQGAFFSQLIEDTTQAGKISTALSLALGQETDLKSFKRIIRDTIKGNQNKLGVISNFQVMTMRTQSAMDQYDRFIQNEYSKSLKLNYAIYQGGEIETTREFCDERNGRVFKREEIADWNKLDWKGKKDAHNIFIDCGGYNCRHYYDWISYELAVQLRPNIGRSRFDLV